MGDWSTGWFCAQKVGPGFIFKLVGSDVGTSEVPENLHEFGFNNVIFKFTNGCFD